MSASGIASFSKERAIRPLPALSGLVAKSADIVVTAKGLPQAVPTIDVAAEFAQDQFKATNSKREPRDAFGVEPSSGHKAC